MPKRVKRKRPIVLDDGSEPGGMEEYYDYIFPVGACPPARCLSCCMTCVSCRQARAGTTKPRD